MRPELRTAIPGPRSLALAEKLRRYESRNVTYLAPDWPIFWERAEGTNVWDVDGNRFLDLTSAFGVASLGHTAPVAREAMIAQAGRLMHAMGDVHPTAVKAELCEQLSAVTFERWGAGTGKVVLGNSGFEAVEAALKTSLLRTGKAGVIAFTGGYHGLGLGALAAGGLPFFQEPFRRQLKEFATLLPYPTRAESLAQLEREIEAALRGREIGAILVEPIQGRGGCVVPPPEFLPLLRRMCDAHGALLILDEILTGFHRTGTFFACEQAGVVPDLICVGKALTGGFPLSACVGREAIMEAWPLSRGEALHTSTFLGNPVGCAVALASLRAHRESNLAAQVQAKGAWWQERLSALASPRVREVRGRGLMLGMELVKPDGTPDTEGAVGIVLRGLREGVLLLADSPTSNVLSLTPSLLIAEDEMAFVVEWLAGALK